jgi:hypothetical protein
MGDTFNDFEADGNSQVSRLSTENGRIRPNEFTSPFALAQEATSGFQMTSLFS